MKTLKLSEMLKVLALGAVMLLAACSDGEQSAPVPTTLTVVSGDGQSGTVGALLGAPLVVEVRDDQGRPAAGVTVSWSVTGGGGSVGSATTTTGSDGQAMTTWTLGGAIGTQTASASSGAGLSAAFSATGSAGPPSSVVVTGDAALGAIGATTQLAGQVVDQFGNAVEGDLTWTTSDDGIATVDASGLVTAVANGEATITAASGSANGTLTVTVAQVAVSLVVSPGSGVTTAGGTLQLTAAGADANGSAVSGLTATWASSDETIVTVDASGLVTGVAQGAATVTATAGDVTGEAAITVAAPPFVPQGDMVVDGDVSAESISVPAGVTVTLTAGATLSSATTLEVAGAIVGPCLATTLSAGTTLTLTGSVSNACADSTAVGPDLTVRAGGAVSMTDATLTSGGSVVVSNAPSPSGHARPLRLAEGPGVGTAPSCLYQTVNILVFGVQDGVSGDPTGGNGSDGHDITIVCAGTLTIEDGFYLPGPGGAGGRGSSRVGSEARGGDGGRAGRVVMAAPRIEFLRSVFGPAEILLPPGGRGGLGSSTGGDAVAYGGRGGDASLPLFIASGGIRVIGLDGAPGVRLQFQRSELVLQGAGSGGIAEARGSDGDFATSLFPAQNGRTGSAFGGRGGDFGTGPVMNLIGDVFQGEVENPTGILLELDNAHAGVGGQAVSTGGNGGAGSEEFPDGADAGASLSRGGEGGDSFLIDNRSGLSIGIDAPGGPAGFRSATLALSGRGGDGFDACGVGRVGIGGRGGAASIGTGSVGRPGLRGGVRGSDHGGWGYDYWGVGGTGGDGSTPGAGGEKGDLSGFVGIGVPAVTEPSLRDGPDGSGCSTAMSTSIVVGSDPNGHAPFIGLQSTALTLGLGPNGTMTLSGTPPWINLVGTVAEDGSFQLTGTGTAANINGVAVTFTGQLTLDQNNRITGIASGTLTYDANNNRFPPDVNGFSNPTVYNVTGTAN